MTAGQVLCVGLAFGGWSMRRRNHNKAKGIGKRFALGWGWRLNMNEFWYCNACEAQNHVTDGECQFCECDGAECRRDNCSDPKHFTESNDGT